MNDISVIPLLRGGYAIVDADMFGELSKIPWRRSDSNHIAAWVNGKYLYLHRLVNKTPDGIETDHKNRNPFDNRRCNLRNATQTQNRGNMEKFKGTYSSKFKGISWHMRSKKWIASIRVKNKLHHLGYFITEADAAAAYDKAALVYFGEFAKLNVI